MRLLVDNSYAMIVDATEDQIRTLDTRFSVWRKDRFFRGRFSKQRKHPVKLLQGNLIPTGIIPYVLKEFPQFDISVEDTRKKPTRFREDIIQPNPPELLPFQKAAVDFCLAKERALVVSITGSGKTYVIGELARRLMLPALILVGSRSPLLQIQERISDFIKPEYVGVVGAGHKNDNIVTVATYPSAKNMPLYEYPVIIVDEVHHAAAETYQEILKHAANTYWRFGVTGTIKGRADGLEILTEAVISSNTYEVPKEDVKEQLGMPEVRVGLITIKLPYNTVGVDAYDNLIVNNNAVNDIITTLACRYQERTVLIYVERIDHGDLLNKLMPGSVFVFGDTPLDDREALRRNIKGKVVIGTSVFAESIDTADIGVVINAAANKSPIRLAQLLGRAMRGGSDKVVLAFDFIHKDGATFERRSRKRSSEWRKRCDLVGNVDLDSIQGAR